MQSEFDKVILLLMIVFALQLCKLTARQVCNNLKKLIVISAVIVIVGWQTPNHCI